MLRKGVGGEKYMIIFRMIKPKERDNKYSIRDDVLKKKYINLVSDIIHAREVRLYDADYKFHEFSVGERGTKLSPELLREVKCALVDVVNNITPKIDLIITIVPGGHPWALLVGEALGLPVEIIRDNGSVSDDEIMIWQKSLLHNRKMYFRRSRDKEYKSVLFIDDVISTGGTSEFVINEYEKLGLKIGFVLAVILKGHSYIKIQQNTGAHFYGLIEINNNEISQGPIPLTPDPHPENWTDLK
jgi:adenine/guanine phosphoribosyltransferase-like PRPP-binding protein